MQWLPFVSGLLAVAAASQVAAPNAAAPTAQATIPAAKSSTPTPTASTAPSANSGATTPTATKKTFNTDFTGRSQLVFAKVEKAIAENPTMPLTLAFGAETFKDRKMSAFALSLAKNPLYTLALRLDQPTAEQMKNFKGTKGAKRAVSIAEKFLTEQSDNWAKLFKVFPQFVAVPIETPQEIIDLIVKAKIIPIVPTDTLKSVVELSEANFRKVFAKYAIILHRATSKVETARMLADLPGKLKHATTTTLQNADEFYYGPLNSATPSTPAAGKSPAGTANTTTSTTTTTVVTTDAPQTSATPQTAPQSKTVVPNNPVTAVVANTVIGTENKQPTTPDTTANAPANKDTAPKTDNTPQTEEKVATEQTQSEAETSGGIGITTILIIVGVAVVVVALLAFAYKKMKN